VEQASLDWSTAEVKNGVLSVGLDGERPKGWNKTFAATAAMLGGGTWSKVALRKDRIKVTGVTPGVEDKLHHFLESVVLQTNADHAPETEDDSDGDGEQELEQESGQGDSDDDPDSELTSRFKAFAD
jgi:hypothetical protein